MSDVPRCYFPQVLDTATVYRCDWQPRDFLPLPRRHSTTERRLVVLDDHQRFGVLLLLLRTTSKKGDDSTTTTTHDRLYKIVLLDYYPSQARAHKQRFDEYFSNVGCGQAGA